MYLVRPEGKHVSDESMDEPEHKAVRLIDLEAFDETWSAPT